MRQEYDKSNLEGVRELGLKLRKLVIPLQLINVHNKRCKGFAQALTITSWPPIAHLIMLKQGKELKRSPS